jgi:penicillin-binding protein 2
MRVFSDKLRTFIIISGVIASMTFASYQLMKIQIVDGEKNLEKQTYTYDAFQTIHSTRGEIVDNKNRPIVENKLGFNLIIEKAYFPNNNEKANQVIIETIKILKDYNFKWIESLPISQKEPYKFLNNKEDDVSKLKSKIGVNIYATAENCIDKLIYDYKISDKYSKEEQRIIAGIRYEMLNRDFSVDNSFLLCQDINIEVVTKIKELGLYLPGVNVAEDAIRHYSIVDVIPHSIGTVGPIYAEEYEELKSRGYLLNDIVGKSGIEKAMENYLRGKNGTKKITFQNSEVLETEITEPAVPGNTIKLTVDSEFQRKIQGVLENFIVYLKENPGDKPQLKNVTSGAIVVTDVKTGAILAMATAPTYNMTDYVANYSDILERPNQPLINRATDGVYRPGSTFKTITATAGLNEGAITPSSTFFCGQTYHYLDITVGCTGYHSNISVAKAIEVSCNIFFYELSQLLGIDKLSKYASMYGLGEKTGIETGDSAGYIANPETFEKFEIPWTSGQLLQAAIGQSEVGVTPLQLAMVASTIANKGTRYKPFLVDSINSYLGEEIIKTQPTVLESFPINYDYVYESINQGMIAVSKNTPAGEFSLNNLGYDVAIKTGTPESSRGVDSVVIGYAPADNPQIAFSAIIEGGEYSKFLVRKILDAYFNP